MNIIVCGSREWAAGDGPVFERLCNISDADDDVLIITGGAKGIDTTAHNIATGLGYGTRVYFADWTRGRAAGPLRNQQMLDEGKPDLVIAFWDGKSRGTADMIRRSKEAGVVVEIISP